MELIVILFFILIIFFGTAFFLVSRLKAVQKIEELTLTCKTLSEKNESIQTQIDVLSKYQGIADAEAAAREVNRRIKDN